MSFLLSEPFTFRGNVTVTHSERPNPLIGPPGAQLISLGALYPPCIREDYAFNVYMVHALQLHVGEGGEKLGCCEVEEVNAAGTTTKVKCSDSKWNPVLLISSYCAPPA